MCMCASCDKHSCVNRFKHCTTVTDDPVARILSHPTRTLIIPTPSMVHAPPHARARPLPPPSNSRRSQTPLLINGG